MKKIFLTVVILLVITLTSCDGFMTEPTNSNKSYLSIKQNTQYGGDINHPGVGLYSYENGATAEIEMTVTPGYEFAGWVGEHGDKVIEVEPNKTWKIKVNDRMMIEADYKLNEFKLLSTEPEDGEIDVSVEIDEIILIYNNEVDRNKIGGDFTIEGENVEGESIVEDWEVIDNQILLSSLGGFDLFDETLTISIYNEIWDVDNNFAPAYEFSFTFEKSMPEKPTNFAVKVEGDTVLLIWESSSANYKNQGSGMATGYNVYRSTDKENFTLIATLDSGVDYELSDDKIYYEDNEETLNLNEDIYYYQVTALNDNNRESAPSNIKSTE